MIPDVIVIRGPSGVGKSEVSRILRSLLQTGVVIDVDEVRSQLVNIDWSNSKQHTQVLTVVCGMITTYLQLGYNPCILIGTFNNKRLNVLAKEFVSKKLLFISLFAKDDVLLKRLLLRENSYFLKHVVPNYFATVEDNSYSKTGLEQLITEHQSRLSVLSSKSLELNTIIQNSEVPPQIKLDTTELSSNELGLQLFQLINNKNKKAWKKCLFGYVIRHLFFPHTYQSKVLSPI